MGKWLANFSADIPESRTDKADSVGELGTMSGMSVPDIEVSAKNSPDQIPLTPTIQPGDQISWMRAGQRQVGLVDFLHRDSDGQDWAFVTLGENWAAVNLKFVQTAKP